MKYSIEYIIVVWYPELANCAAPALARALVALHRAFALPCPAAICDVAVGYTPRKNSHGDSDDFIVTRFVISTSNRDNLMIIIGASLLFLFRYAHGYATCQEPQLC